MTGNAGASGTHGRCRAETLPTFANGDVLVTVGVWCVDGAVSLGPELGAVRSMAAVDIVGKCNRCDCATCHVDSQDRAAHQGLSQWCSRLSTDLSHSPRLQCARRLAVVIRLRFFAAVPQSRHRQLVSGRDQAESRRCSRTLACCARLAYARAVGANRTICPAPLDAAVIGGHAGRHGRGAAPYRCRRARPVRRV